MKRWKLSPLILCVVFVSLPSLQLQAQNDPGPRPGPPAAGGFYSPLSANEQAFFNQAQAIFAEIDSVSGGIAGEAGKGLGPTFNGNSCAQCHAQPTIGGSSPGLTSPQNPIANPQVVARHARWRAQLRSLIHHRQRPGARSPLRQEFEWNSRRRRTRPVHHRRTLRRRRLQSRAA